MAPRTWSQVVRMYMALVCHEGLELKDKKCEHFKEHYCGANQAGRYVHCWGCKSRLAFVRKENEAPNAFLCLPLSFAGALQPGEQPNEGAGSSYILRLTFLIKSAVALATCCGDGPY